ncbi:MAG: 50S ribosomal protein L22 [Cytophagaceae bacterium]|nr:50S ribosomal protein L22 [Cytophagaceae bacterium]
MEAAVKQRRSVIKRQKKEAAKLAKKQGAAEAILKNVPTSPRKMRLVADIIRGAKATEALYVLKYHPNSAAKRLEKLLLSALANWQGKNEDQNVEDAFIKEIFVDGGRMLKRLRPAPQGRAYRVRKRSNHVTMVIDSLTAPSLTTPVQTSEQEAKPKAKAKTAEGKAKKEKSGDKKTKK